MPFLLASICLAMALFCLSYSTGTDSSWPIQKYLGVFLMSGFILSSTWNIGRHLAKFVGISGEVFFLPLGSALCCLISFLLLAMGIVGPPFAWLWMTLSLLPFLGMKRPSPLIIPSGLLLLFLAILFLAFVPQTHPDPLYYHLLSIRRWYDLRSFAFFPNHPLLFQSGIWELLYFWPLQLISPMPGKELISISLIAQVIHLCMGLGASYFILRKILEKYSLSGSSYWAALVLAQAFMFEISITAKNDGAIFLWGLSAFLLFQSDHIRQGKYWCAFLLGLAISNKWTSAIGFAPFLLLFFFQLSGQKSKVFFVLSFILGALPILLRNYHFTGLPFFPLFAGQETPLLSPTDKALFFSYSKIHVSFPELGNKLLRILEANPLNILCFAFLPFLKVLEARRRIVVIGSMIAFALGAIFLHPSLSWRITGITPFLLSISAVFFLDRFFQNKFKNDYSNFLLKSGAYIYLVFLLMPLAPPFPLVEPAAAIRNSAGGDAMAWLRLHEVKDKIAFAGNAELYYVEGHDAVDIDMSPAIDSKLTELRSVKSMVSYLRSENYKYLVETASISPRGRTAGFFASLFSSYSKEGIVFSGGNSRVWDLQALEFRMAKSDYVDPPHEFKGFKIEQQK